MLVLLEGNIAAGKTTLGERLAASEHFAFYPEPLSQWQTGYAANLLARFYTDTPRWAFTMQIGAFVTRANALALRKEGEHAVFERSIYCDRHVFAKNLYETGLLDETEWGVYIQFWEYASAAVPRPDAILYLRTPAEECYRRLQARARAEESAVSLAYLQQLEAQHDAWLLGPAPEAPVVLLDGEQSWEPGAVLSKLLDAVPEARATAPEPAPSAEPGCILVVDDDWTNREMLRAYLKRAGYEVKEANSGEQALEQAARCAPALIMLDVQMPVMDGYETCRRLKQDPATREIPVVMITAHEDGDGERARAAGANDVVRKPFNAQSLLVMIERLLNG